MITPVKDERTFENAVTLSAEETASNAEHFEAKAARNGTSVKVEDDAQPPVVVKATPPVVPETPKPDAAVTPTVDSAAPVVEDNPDLNEEDRADWHSATNDGEKLGKYAKRTKKIHELDATVKERDTKIAELQRQLEEKSRQPAQNPLVVPVVASEPPKVTEAPKPEAPKVAAFDKPKPVVPKFSDFQDAEDPIAAHAEAVAGFAEAVSDWKDEKREFERKETQRVENETKQQEAQRTRQVEKQQTIAQKFESARAEHSDLDNVLQTTNFTPTLQYLFLERLPDGVKLAYQLGLSKNSEVLKAITEQTKTGPNPTAEDVDNAVYNGLQALAVFREKLKSESVVAATPPVEEPVKTPVVAAPVVAPPAEPPVQPPPVVTQPRKEDAAPTPVRGRAGAPVERPEDVDPMDSDARRRLRRQLAR